MSASPALAAQGDAEVRFVHAVPGVGTATVSVGGKEAGEVGFGETSDQIPVPAGPSDLELVAPGGVELTATEELDPARGYLVAALATEDGAELRLFRDQPAAEGGALLRVIHAAPELGDADLTVDGEVVSEQAAYNSGTGYLDLQPGTYEVAAEAPGSGEAVVSEDVQLAAGTSDTVLVVGSRGEQTRMVVVEDDVAAPTGAPQTGLGGLAGGGPDWLAAIIASIAAGALGLLGVSLASRRGRLRRLPTR